MKAMAGVGMAPELDTVVAADDGIARCRWATETSRDLTAYHDREWGVPTHDEALLFEALAMTYSRTACHGRSSSTSEQPASGVSRFDPGAVAAMTVDDVERLMADRAIIVIVARSKPPCTTPPAVEISAFATGRGDTNRVDTID